MVRAMTFMASRPAKCGPGIKSPRRLPESARILSNRVRHLARGAPLQIGVADDRRQRAVAEKLGTQDEMETLAIGRGGAEGNAEDIGKVRARLDCQQAVEHRMAATGECPEDLATAAGTVWRAVLATVVEAEQTALRCRFGNGPDQFRGEGSPVPSRVVIELIQVPGDRRGKTWGQLRKAVQDHRGCGGTGSEEPTVEGGQIAG